MERQYSPMRGFTLIELLVTVAIVATLAALIFAGMRNVVEKSNTIVCLNNLRQIGVAAQLYATDNSGWVMPCAPEDSPANAGWFYYVPFLVPYLAEKEKSKALECPGDKAFKNPGVYSAGYGSSYASNIMLYFNGQTYKTFKGMDVVNPSKCIFIGDALIYSKSDVPFYPIVWPRSSWHGQPSSFLNNVLLFDGHVETIKISSSRGAWWSNEAPDAAGQLKWGRF